jgi:hypothetical protein
MDWTAVVTPLLDFAGKAVGLIAAVMALRVHLKKLLNAQSFLRCDCSLSL